MNIHENTLLSFKDSIKGSIKYAISIPPNIGEINERKLEMNGKTYNAFKITITNKTVVRGNNQDNNKCFILTIVSLIQKNPYWGLL